MLTPEGAAPSPQPSQDLAVFVEDLAVQFSVYAESQLSVRELAARGFRSRQSSVVEAIRGVSMTIHVGEAVGIVGSNGSGKSTLLRAMAGLQSPSQGRVLVRSQPQLLGVAPALNRALTGRRNIELGTLAMGWSMDDVRENMEAVIEFSEVGDAIDRPLKTYSSGMRARLAFSIATLRTPDILLIDEALAVGDRKFRNKSLERLNEIKKDAGAVIMVTHNLNEIRSTCSRTIWMESGLVVADGETEEILEAYESES